MISDSVTIVPALAGLIVAGTLNAYEASPTMTMIVSIGISVATAGAVIYWVKKKRDAKITIEANNFIIK